MEILFCFLPLFTPLTIVRLSLILIYLLREEEGERRNAQGQGDGQGDVKQRIGAILGQRAGGE